MGKKVTKIRLNGKSLMLEFTTSQWLKAWEFSQGDFKHQAKSYLTKYLCLRLDRVSEHHIMLASKIQKAFLFKGLWVAPLGKSTPLSKNKWRSSQEWVEHIQISMVLLSQARSNLIRPKVLKRVLIRLSMSCMSLLTMTILNRAKKTIQLKSWNLPTAMKMWQMSRIASLMIFTPKIHLLESPPTLCNSKISIVRMLQYFPVQAQDKV